MKHNFRNLEIWKESIDLAVEIYKQTGAFPTDERFNLTSQMRKCSVSISSNISEDAGRNTNKDFVHFLGISNGSGNELITQLIISEKLGLLNPQVTSVTIEKIESIQKRICSLQRKFRDLP